MTESMYKFEIPETRRSIIKVIGVGGGGSNAVNHMFNQGIRDVEFVVCNTDAQALESSPVPNKLQIGINLTSGLGAGANPERGRNAALESREEIRDLLGENTKMVFITAGMGGGTGTGAAPVIAEIAKNMDILTVGIVTVPFSFEGKKKMAQAEAGIKSLKENCDTVLVILNDKLRMIYGNLSMTEAFNQADNVLTTAAKGIAEIITVPGHVNVDFEDVKAVMKDSGSAVMGSAITSGQDRAKKAAEKAINSPLLDYKNIHGAQKLLLSIMSGKDEELSMDELTQITDFMSEIAGEDVDVIFGHGHDESLGDNLSVTIIATGFEPNTQVLKNIEEKPAEEDKSVIKKIDLESGKQKRLFEDDEESFTLKIQNTPKEVPAKPTENIERKKFEEFKPKQEKPEDNSIDDFDEDFFELDLDRHFDIVDDINNQEEEDAELEELKGAAHPPSKKTILMQQAIERVKRIEGLKGNQQSYDSDRLKEKFDIPAYKRRNVDLHAVPHSSEKSISRYHINDKNDILGNNRWLHDNVD